ncbi:TetR/AcrR family transcriptional regulator C-terminal domain-containing protein [Pseudoxanthomonas koreensis]|uniref:TetR/AcrR family transcriptional regulator C-terminal domain-containing protein n=1 Tax=Pseudoxanthomonas koreensis TaxID=266061 RepID=UPI00139156F5|nr:TetR/AcrR family transcriptional regulator C-terminal domain-containing protein [Pseudoxanthomonas koreensis]KAF1693378.1 TetR family transcriptional regulator [Pseudoxanthomonas koreensis]
MESHTAPAPRPAVDARHQRVRRAVRELVREQGVQISMDAVAARAGCSKQTLYARYGSKPALLLQVMSEEASNSTPLAGQPDAATLRSTLVAFASEHLERLSAPGTIGTARLVTAQACQFPDEVRGLYAIWVAGLQERLAAWLQQAMRRGLLRHDDPHSAAELLLGMITGLDFDRQRFLVPHRDDTPRQARWAEFAVDSFLRAFAPPVSRS